MRIEAVDKGDWKFLKLVEEPEFGPGLPAHTIYVTGLTGGNESLPGLLLVKMLIYSLIMVYISVALETKLQFDVDFVTK